MEYCQVCMRSTMCRAKLEVVLVLFYVILLVYPADSQTGFLSIDCGSSINYVDNRTGIQWESDGPYISTGTNVGGIDVVSPYAVITNKGQLSTARFFNDTKRRRDCYVLPTEYERTYLIRATFFYGNVSANTVTSSFSAYLNATHWFPMKYPETAELYASYTWEAIVYSFGSILNFCLVREEGPSFISALELRRLDNGMYSAAQTMLNNKQQYLFQLSRYYSGVVLPDTDRNLRYPDDIFDRIWCPFTGNGTRLENTTQLRSAVEARAPDLPPVAVMKNASMHYSSDYTDLELSGNPVNIFACAYFQEVDGNASATNVRGMDFYLNDQFIQSFNSSADAIEVHSTVQNVTDMSLRMNIKQSSWSRLPPILNALEYYVVAKFNITQTAANDVALLSSLETSYNLTGWDGDPCVPFPLDGITCTNNNTDEARYRITGLDLNGKGISGSVPKVIFEFKDLTALSLDNNSLTGTISDFNKLPLLQSISLRKNKLTGDIGGFSSLVNLQSLYLENNNLSGSIPEFLSSFQNLTRLHLDNNNFSGDIPVELVSRRGLNFTYSNNPGLKLRAPSTSGLKSSNIGAVVGGLLGGIIGLIVLGVAVWRFATRKKRATSRILKNIHNPLDYNRGRKETSSLPKAGSLRIFSLEEVNHATKKFSREIGRGGFGPVFHGQLPCGQEVAAKVKSESSHQGFLEFLNELELLSRIHHDNLVSLLGYCEEANQEILIYAFLPNGTLQDHLYGDKSKTPLDWKMRLNIAVNSAKGLEYLHFYCNPRIIHRDVKSSNILLDKKMLGKVADFGISKQTVEGMTTGGIDTIIKGTFGYMDPQYFVTRRLTQKSDVYSFGVVLLEIISGRRALIQHEDGSTFNIVDWVRKSVASDNVVDIFDPLMENKFNHQSIWMVLDLALDCLKLETSERPDMHEVLRRLQCAAQLEEVSRDQEMLTSTTDNDERDEEPLIPDEAEDTNGVPIVSRSESQRCADESYISSDRSIIEPR